MRILIFLDEFQIKENIGLGDPHHASDITQIQEAARLGGAEDVIKELPNGLDTWLQPPVTDVYSRIPEGTKTLFGKKVDFSKIRQMGNLHSTINTNLSGGQLQRLAVCVLILHSNKL
jgi:ABC-type multidrug transport system fused ATPase/permease subunit